jgi:hypothetical protein
VNQRQVSSLSYPMTFFMYDSLDHINGKTGLTPTVALSKNGGAFGPSAGAVSEIGNGWYALAPNTTDRDTLGDLLLHATAVGADPFDGRYEIVTDNPFHQSSAVLSDATPFDGADIATILSTVADVGAVPGLSDSLGFAITSILNLTRSNRTLATQKTKFDLALFYAGEEDVDNELDRFSFWA